MIFHTVFHLFFLFHNNFDFVLTKDVPIQHGKCGSLEQLFLISLHQDSYCNARKEEISSALLGSSDWPKN